MRCLAIAFSVLVVFWTLGVSHADTKHIRILDAGDPATFNAQPPVGPGLGAICQEHPHDGVTVEEFAELLTRAAFGHPAWRFHAHYLEIASGAEVRVTNRGGEDHTFTEVSEQFGGGRVAGLNAPLGLTALPQCAEALAPVIHPGDSIQIKNLSEGTHYYLCCI